jgi:hypothetical protein
LAAELLVAQIVPAQGTIYLSNLGETPVGSGAIGTDSWLAQYFAKGTNSPGYTPNSVRLLMNAAVGNSSGFTAAIYSSPGNGAPWTIPDAYYSSADGSSWALNARQNIFQFAIDANANAVPEPGVPVLFVLGGLSNPSSATKVALR